jgi:hypothetical protein
MRAFIHGQETCIWLGSLAGLTVAICLLEPLECRPSAKEADEESPPLVEIQPPRPQSDIAWWKSPST